MEEKMAKQKAALLTAGGLAPCLSSAVGGLIERYSDVAPDVELIAYRSGYQGVLLGDSIEITGAMREKAGLLHYYGGSPIGNSRVKLTNIADCVKRNLVKEGENPLRVAAERLTRDGVTILHTIGGDDTNTTAADLAAYLDANGYKLTVVGLPKTVDNDIVPIRQSLGAWTAAEVGAQFHDNISNEQSAAPRTLVVHEVMGRHSGWLTAATARAYIQKTRGNDYVDGLMMNAALKSIDGIYLPEIGFDFDKEGMRLRKIMDKAGFATIFVSEGAGLDAIVAERETAGEQVKRDAFGHVKIDTINVGNWFSKQLGQSIGAERAMVQKSGYFARSAPANKDDLRLIQGMVDLAVESALNRVSGVTGHDEDQGGKLRTVEFERIKGGKHLDTAQPWFGEMMAFVGQDWVAL
jgi:pyrophosphate--fructose-6-phosphate 1-phosphotransferase